MDARQRWARALEAWAIPEEILERAPESPWGFPPSLFAHRHGERDAAKSPSHRRALEELPERGSVIDVGAGPGASSLPLASRAARITAVDASDAMLERFVEAAGELGIEHREIQGTWPDVAERAGTADVVVCHHVFYNVPDLAFFADALTRAARRRVVVELTATHPAATLNHLWRHFHGLERPTEPTFEDALDVLHEVGIDAEVERWERPPRRHDAPRAEVVAFARRRLCLPAERDQEIDDLLGPSPVWNPTEIATLWWPGTAEGPG